LPLPVRDQKRFLLCRNTTFSKDNVRAAALVSGGIPPGGMKMRLAGYGLEDACADMGVIRMDRRPNQISTEGDPADRAAAANARDDDRLADAWLAVG
jgi:hypothetical protein